MNTKSFSIKNLDIYGRTFLAPLAGITNLPFRSLIKSMGCAVVCSEMISAKGLFYNSDKTFQLLKSNQKEQPLSVQLFGSDPLSMAKAAETIQKLDIAGLIDINFGCSVRKVVKQGAGVALMKEPTLTEQLLKEVRKATDLPLTIKIRSGWDASGNDAFKIAAIAEDAGVDAIAFHPRTASQLFRGTSDWKLIRELKKRLSIPLIGNGDINIPEDAKTMINMTGCDAVMVGRAAMANPFILAQIEQYLETGIYDQPSRHDIFRAMEKLTTMYIDYFGEKTACKMLRGRLSWFVKGMPGCSAFRKELTKIRSGAHAMTMIRHFETSLG